MDGSEKSITICLVVLFICIAMATCFIVNRENRKIERALQYGYEQSTVQGSGCTFWRKVK